MRKKRKAACQVHFCLRRGAKALFGTPFIHEGAPREYEQRAMPDSGGAEKNSPEKCLVDLGRDTRTKAQSRRLVRRKDASWSLNWPSGTNLLAHEQYMCILFVPL